MKYDEIENIWTADVRALSNAARGKVYFERAKQVVAQTLNAPWNNPNAIRNGKYSRSYLVERIGAQPAVTTQNPGIRALLREADERLSKGAAAATAMPNVRSSSSSSPARPVPGTRSAKETELQAIVDDLRRVNEVQAAEIGELKRLIRDNEWIDSGLAQHGALPW